MLLKLIDLYLNKNKRLLLKLQTFTLYYILINVSIENLILLLLYLNCISLHTIIINN